MFKSKKVKKEKAIQLYEELGHLFNDVVTFLERKSAALELEGKEPLTTIKAVAFNSRNTKVHTLLSVLRAYPSNDIEWLKTDLMWIAKPGAGSLAEVYFGEYYGDRASEFQNRMNTIIDELKSTLERSG